MRSDAVILPELTDLVILRGVPTYIRSDNGPALITKAVRDWIKAVGARPLTLSQDRRGRTDIAKASTGECATNF